MTENGNAIESVQGPETPAGHTVVGIRFRQCGKIYTFEINGIDVSKGSKVVVESEMGLSLGVVVMPKHIIEKSKEPLKKVIRVASEKDFETIENNRSLEDEAKAFCIEKAAEYGLLMKVVTTETTLDKKRLVFYFTADGRIDFRELVRDLAAKFKTRIEMRQIGVRDEVKLIGGIGACGRQTCCSLFLTSFEPITIRMAKQQELSINQSKLSGICGRLMCCLGYECKDADEARASALTEKSETMVQIGEESGEESLVTADSESIISVESQQPSVCSCTCLAEQAKEKETAARHAPQIREEVTEERKHHKRRRRNRRRRKPSSGKPSVEGQPQEKLQAATKPRDSETQQTEQKGKGKPFSKRRKFWKKKKNSQ
jgi:cell fate regulator YaaT (PSP1 superfamily)